MFAEWLAAIETTIAESTHGLWSIYVSAHYLDTFDTSADFTAGKAAEYMRRRLGEVSRETVKKELSALRSFFRWLAEQEHTDGEIKAPAIPRSALGVRATTRHRGRADMGPGDVARILAALPVWSSESHPDRFPVRSFFVVLWETGLRPATVEAVSVPEHYRPGVAGLRIDDAIDKARFGRTVPLTPEAVAALDAHASSGVIFGAHDWRGFLRRAAAAAGLHELAERVTPYDLRHARATALAAGGDLPGAAFLLGHRKVSTTDIYARPNARAARALLARVGGVSGGESCEGRDLNSYGSNPASTSRIGVAANAENCAAGDAQKCAGNTVQPRRVGDAPPELIGLRKALTHLAADPLWALG
jgi:integrase